MRVHGEEQPNSPLNIFHVVRKRDAYIVATIEDRSEVGEDRNHRSYTILTIPEVVAALDFWFEAVPISVRGSNGILLLQRCYIQGITEDLSEVGEDHLPWLGQRSIQQSAPKRHCLCLIAFTTTKWQLERSSNSSTTITYVSLGVAVKTTSFRSEYVHSWVHGDCERCKTCHRPNMISKHSLRSSYFAWHPDFLAWSI